MTAGDWSWPPGLDGVIAAPESHRVLLETPHSVENIDATRYQALRVEILD